MGGGLYNDHTAYPYTGSIITLTHAGLPNRAEQSNTCNQKTNIRDMEGAE